MKRTIVLALACMMTLALLACSGGAPAAAPSATQAPTAVVTEAPEATKAPETDAPDADAPYFIVSYEDATPVPETIEAKTGKDNAVKLFFAIENGEGMIGWDEALDNAGILHDMNFEFINEKGLLITVWSEQPAECKAKFYLNGSDDWANPDVLSEQYFTFIFTE